ncbi:MAG TPA: hypothetical protein VI815_02440 [Candidatus Nanoarchaeia archaeon]|nr:hypothetical protein [Candidatus Nanoarchaeia archaeon]
MSKELIIPKSLSHFKDGLHYLAFDTLNAQAPKENRDHLKLNGYNTVEELINGDFDLQIYHAENLIMHIDLEQKGIFFTEASLEQCLKIANLGEDKIMELYSKHDISHDGGDDFDYGQSFPGMLFDIMDACVKDETTETAVYLQ